MLAAPGTSSQPAKIFSPTRKWGLPHVIVIFVSGSERQICRIFSRTFGARGMVIPVMRCQRFGFRPDYVRKHLRLAREVTPELRSQDYSNGISISRRSAEA